MRAVIHIRLAIVSLESVDADAVVPAVRVGAGCPVEAGVADGALIHVLSAVLAGVLGRAVAGVAAHPVHALAAVLAQVVRAVVDVHLAPVAGET